MKRSTVGNLIFLALFLVELPFSSYSMVMPLNGKEGGTHSSNIGRLEELKAREAQLSHILASVRQEKLSIIRSRPLTIGIVGFGRFGQFIARTFKKYSSIVATSRSDYSQLALGIGVKYVPLSDLDSFFAEDLDVILVCVSITSFEPTIRKLIPYIKRRLEQSQISGESGPGPLIVDVCSVKEHPRQVMLDLLPPQCDILCTHPMFGPDSGKNGWHGLNFVFERTRIDGVILDPNNLKTFHQLSELEEHPNDDGISDSFLDIKGDIHHIHESNEAHLLGMDRMERFLSIWEEEGCRMVALSCHEHDQFAANSQFITHLMGRVLGSQGLKPTPIDTRGFESVLKLIGNTMADSFDLFYGLYKYNQNSVDTILKLRVALDDVVQSLRAMESAELKERQDLPASNEKLFTAPNDSIK